MLVAIRSGALRRYVHIGALECVSRPILGGGEARIPVPTLPPNAKVELTLSNKFSARTIRAH